MKSLLELEMLPSEIIVSVQHKCGFTCGDSCGHTVS